MRLVTTLTAAYIALGCATSCFAHGGGGGFGGGNGFGGVNSGSSGPIGSTLPSTRRHFTIEQVKYAWDMWYGSAYSALGAEAVQLSGISTADAYKVQLASIQYKEEKLRSDFARKLRNKNILVTPQQVLQVASD